MNSHEPVQEEGPGLIGRDATQGRSRPTPATGGRLDEGLGERRTATLTSTRHEDSRPGMRASTRRRRRSEP